MSVFEKSKKQSVIKLEMPSGEVFELLPVRVSQYAPLGRIPMFYIRLLASAQNQPEKELSDEQMNRFGLAMAAITRDVLLNNLVFPKVTARETENSITPEQLNAEDLEYLLAWIGGGAQSSDAGEILTLLEDEEDFTFFALACESNGIRGSEVLEIEDNLTAFQFDAACAYVCRRRENAQSVQRLEAQVKSIGALFGANFSDAPSANEEEY